MISTVGVLSWQQGHSPLEFVDLAELQVFLRLVTSRDLQMADQMEHLKCVKNSRKQHHDLPRGGRLISLPMFQVVVHSE
jgi:hypothetical protein